MPLVVVNGDVGGKGGHGCPVLLVWFAMLHIVAVPESLLAPLALSRRDRR